MQLHRIVAATDGSPAGRQAVTVAAQLAGANGARLDLITVVSKAQSGRPAFPAAFDIPPVASTEVVVAVGLPGVEIVRYAERASADLIVLGRTSRPPAVRRLIGDTGDAVARRSSITCLFVPEDHGPIGRVLAALDGTDRGSRVLRVAADFARAFGGRFRAVTIEPPVTDGGVEPAGPVWGPRTTRLANLLEQARLQEPELFGPWDGGSGSGRVALTVRIGQTVEAILDELDHCGAGVLAVGHHRGGPAGDVEGGSVSRRLLHRATTAVLTVPL
ncbi:MAG: universal stress protein [Gemmatimonadota bacterium]